VLARRHARTAPPPAPAPDPAQELRRKLDEPADAELLDAIVGALGRDRARQWREVVAFLRAHPDLVAINGSVRQKQVEEG
jgi:spore coat polysaccharide biosynthesis protein SpsF (cytidylyltransferase family)